MKIPRLIAKKDVWWWKLLGMFYPFAYHLSWTTIGHTIYYPPYVEDPWLPQYAYVRVHEHTHIMQYEKYSVPLFLFLYLFFPLPFFFSYFRWKFEREAYMTELHAGAPIDAIVEVLWNDYGRPWPKKWMTKWFESQQSITQSSRQ